MAMSFRAPSGRELMAFGAGLAGGPNWGQGLARGLYGAGRARDKAEDQEFKQAQLKSLQDHRAATLALQQSSQAAINDYRNRSLGMQQAQNDAVNAYRTRSLDMQAANQAAMKDYRNRQLSIAEAAKDPANVREFKFARQNGYEGSFSDWVRQSQAGSETYGLNPIRVQDADGNVQLVQPGNRGSSRVMQLPEGTSPAPSVSKVDVGTGTALVDKQGNVVGVVPKEIAEAESQKVQGKARGEAVTGLGQAERTAQDTLAVIDQVVNHPGLDSAMGVVQGRLPSLMANPMDAQNVEDFRNIKKQLEGKAFLQAFESLKGGGHITEIEGRKATEAIAVLGDTTSEAEFKRQMEILRGIVTNGLASARRKAGAPNADGWQSFGNVKIREKK